MIEKLGTKEFEKDCGAFGILVERKFATDEEMQEKINEIIEAINPILEERESGIKVYEEVMPNMQPADPYAEQRKWIGKLCFFWGDNKEEDTCYAVLGDIIEYSDAPFEAKDYALWYKNCEPVSPDDDIIYKKD